jgi:hypothetical protein
MEGSEMKRFAILVCLSTLAAAGCGSDNPNGPSNQPTVFTVALKASNETPPITNSESNATGTAVVTVNTTKDASGTVTGGTFDFNVSLTGFPPNTNVILAHIHTGAAGVPGSVLVNTGVSAGDNIVLTNGSGTFTKTGIQPKTLADLQNILSNPAGFYFNVHTTVNPNGAVRGQLQ